MENKTFRSILGFFDIYLDIEGETEGNFSDKSNFGNMTIGSHFWGNFATKLRILILCMIFKKLNLMRVLI